MKAKLLLALFLLAAPALADWMICGPAMVTAGLCTTQGNALLVVELTPEERNYLIVLYRSLDIMQAKAYRPTLICAPKMVAVGWCTTVGERFPNPLTQAQWDLREGARLKMLHALTGQ